MWLIFCAFLSHDDEFREQTSSLSYTSSHNISKSPYGLKSIEAIKMFCHAAFLMGGGIKAVVMIHDRRRWSGHGVVSVLLSVL